MTPLAFTVTALLVSILAGLLGALLGMGGGIIVVPTLTLVLGIDIRLAIGASIVSVIATSCGAAAGYVRARLANMRVAMLLEAATVSGAIIGAFLAGVVATRFLYILFSLVMAYVCVQMYRGPGEAVGPPPPDPLADRLSLQGSYFDPELGRQVDYRVTRSWVGLAVSFVAGIASGLLGIGGGPLKVPAMHLAMRMPLKAATATSNFMIGVTAAASAGVYFRRGDIFPFVAAPVAFGVLIGAMSGARLLGTVKSHRIRLMFVVVLAYVSAQMLWKGLHS